MIKGLLFVGFLVFLAGLGGLLVGKFMGPVREDLGPNLEDFTEQWQAAKKALQVKKEE